MTKLTIRQISESEFTVQGHGVHTAYKELTWALEKRDDVEVIVNSGGKADVTHIHTIGAYSLRYLLFGSGKKVVSAHVIPKSFIGSLVAAKYWLPLANIYIRWFYNRADLILAVSDETKHQLIQLGVKKPIDVFYNIIDTKRYASSPKIKAEARKKLGIDTDTFMVVCSGQVQPRKRVDTFLNVAKKLDMHFVWVGGMPFGAIAADNHRLNEVMKNSPKNVQFTGVIPLDDVKQYYQAADVFFLPSEQETFGLVVVEAAAAGLPVLLRDIPDYAQTFAGDAIMSDEAGFAKQLQRLADDSKYYTKAVAGSNRIAKRYDSTAGAATAVALYKNLLKK